MGSTRSDGNNWDQSKLKSNFTLTPDLIKYQIERQLLEDIRIATNQGMVLGNERFTAEIESLTGRRTAKKFGARRINNAPVRPASASTTHKSRFVKATTMT